MHVGDLVRLESGTYDGVGIITAIRVNCANAAQRGYVGALHEVQWNDGMGDGIYWADELEVVSESR